MKRENEKSQKRYQNSKHKWVYRWIALKHLVSPQDVYNIAHGYCYMYPEFYKIWRDLVKCKIIHVGNDNQ